MLKLLTCIFILIAILMIAVSTVTTRKAKGISGDDHYLFTQTYVPVERRVPARNPTDAAIDEAYEGEDELTNDTVISESNTPSIGATGGVMTVHEPLFVLGFLDATGPVIVVGGCLLAIAWVNSRRINQKRAQGADVPPIP